MRSLREIALVVTVAAGASADRTKEQVRRTTELIAAVANRFDIVAPPLEQRDPVTLVAFKMTYL